MEKHYGQIVEYVVRKNGYSITDLAEGMDLNRRTLYNYFQNKYLKYDVIHKIGIIVRHDFSREFPELFTSDQFELKPIVKSLGLSTTTSDEDYWKDKYIQLLEVYNEALGNRVFGKTPEQSLAATA